MLERINLSQIFSINIIKNHCVLILFGLKLSTNILRLKSFFLKSSKLKHNKIIFNNFQGGLYGCNPKYIAEEIIKRNLPYELVWLVDNLTESNKKSFPEGIKLVEMLSPQMLEELFTAKIIIGNVRSQILIRNGWRKHPQQYYIQTWHGSLGIKKIDQAANYQFVNINKSYCQLAQKDSSYIDILLSNSTFEDNVYKNSFWYTGNISKTGHPRNDIFFKKKEELEKIKQKVFKNLNINLTKKVLLYIPSFRDDNDLNCYHLNTETLRKSLIERFGGEWIIAIRLHPRLKNFAQSLFNFDDKNIVNASLYPDIQELLVSGDVAISDYSSCIFDFMLSKKPAFIYAEDIEKYDTDRGFYYSLESTPFPIAKNNEDLCVNIQNFDNKKYKTDVENFLHEKGCMEDGHASERIVDLIEEIINA